jgi:hypothetical protein
MKQPSSLLIYPNPTASWAFYLVNTQYRVLTAKTRYLRLSSVAVRQVFALSRVPLPINLPWAKGDCNQKYLAAIGPY